MTFRIGAARALHHGRASGRALGCVAMLAAACGVDDGAGASEEVELLTGTYDISLQTSLGDIALEIDADAAPLAATSFVIHTRNGYYDGVAFHRVVADFMIQGGDPGGTGSGGESVFGDTFADEPNELTMDRGVVAMANRGPNTNGSQFFIVQARAGAPHLLGKHTIFGRVAQGLDVVDAVAAVPTDADDRPLSPITMTPVER